MTRRFFCLSILFAPLMVILANTATQAQITAPGPYYAVPSWDQTFPTATRFVILSNMNGEAVLDRETGLVWERTVTSTSATWQQAQNNCFSKHVGGRRGWRLAKLHELMSLIDVPNLPLGVIGLPPGHPFALPADSGTMWSASYSPTLLDGPGSTPFTIHTFNLSGFAIGVQSPLLPFQYWCVRGHDGQ